MVGRILLYSCYQVTVADSMDLVSNSTRYGMYWFLCSGRDMGTVTCGDICSSVQVFKSPGDREAQLNYNIQKQQTKINETRNIEMEQNRTNRYWSR